MRFGAYERPEPKTPCPTSRSYKLLEVSKNYKMSKESQAYYNKIAESVEDYQRGLVIDKIMEMIND